MSDEMNKSSEMSAVNSDDKSADLSAASQPGVDQQATPANRRRNPVAYGCLAGILGALIVVAGLWFLNNWLTNRFYSGMTVSDTQLRKIYDAVVQYEKDKGHRPAAIADMVAAGLLTTADLFDPERKDVKLSSPASCPSEAKLQGDFLYFSALRRDDPGELVLLCTALLKDCDDTYCVIYNDGRAGRLDAHELTVAMQKTYYYISDKISGPTTASAPTTSPAK